MYAMHILILIQSVNLVFVAGHVSLGISIVIQRQGVKRLLTLRKIVVLVGNHVQLVKFVPMAINVLPIPAPPASHPDAMWLPARDVQLSEDWSRSPDEMEVGEPVTRNVSLSALGQIETQPTLFVACSI